MESTTISRRGAFATILGGVPTLPTNEPNHLQLISEFRASCGRVMTLHQSETEVVYTLKTPIAAWLEGETETERMIANRKEVVRQQNIAKSQPVVLDPNNDLTEENIQRVTQLLVEADRENFADNLETAWELHRRYPHLVTSPEYPAEFLADFHRRNDNQEPGTTCNYSDDCMDEAKNRLACRRRAIEQWQR